MKCYLNLTALMLGLVFSQAFNIASIAAPSQAITSQQCENIEVAKDYQKQGQYQYAIECFNQLLKNPLADKAELYYQLADSYYLRGQYIMSKRMLKEYDNQNDKNVSRKAFVDSLKGLAKADLGDLALDDYNKALGSLSSKQDRATVLLSLGDSYTKFSEKHKGYLGTANMKYGAVLSSFFTAEISSLLTMSDQADSCQNFTENQKAELRTAFQDSSILYKSLHAIIRLYQNQKNNKNNKSNFKCIIDLIVTNSSFSNSDPRTQALIYNEIGDAYAYIAKLDGDNREENYQKAETNYLKALDLSTNYNYVNILVSKNIGNFYKNYGDFFAQNKSNDGTKNFYYKKSIESYETVIKLTRNKILEEASSIKQYDGKELLKSEELLQDQVIENNSDIYGNLIQIYSQQLESNENENESEQTKEKIFKYMEKARTSVKSFDDANGIKEIKEKLSKHTINTTLIEYFVTKDQIFVLLIDPQKETIIFPLPNGNPENVKKAIDQFYQYDLVEKGQLCNKETGQSDTSRLCYPESLKKLYEILFRPIENKIGSSNLIIVPHSRPIQF